MFYSSYSQTILKLSGAGEKGVEWEAMDWQSSTKYYLVWNTLFFHTFTFTQSVNATENVDNSFIQITLNLKTMKGC